MPVASTTAGMKPINMVRSYSIVLKARNRLLRINLFFNIYTNCRASGSAITHLSSFLRKKCGDTAVGILVGDTVYRNDEELMRDATIKSNESYFVLYADYTPSYGECCTSPPIYHDERPSVEGRYLPEYNDAEVTGYLKPAYFEELVYYPTIPLVHKTITLKLSFGRRASITLTNHCVDHADNFRHELYLKAGYKAQGVLDPSGTIHTTDDIIWSSEIEHGGVYKVVKENTGYSLTAQPLRPAAVVTRSSAISMPSRESLGQGIRRISSSTTRSMHRVTSRNSTAAVADQIPSVRVK